MLEEMKPRERAVQEGVGALSDQELLTLMLGTGHSGKAATSVAGEILDLAQGCLNNLATWPIESLTSIHGIGQAKAKLIAAGMELGRR